MGPTTITVLWLYFFCYFGSHLTQQFFSFSEATYQLDWYMLPLDLQKHLPTALSLTQKRIFLQGYGGIGCTLEIFLMVLKLN